MASEINSYIHYDEYDCQFKYPILVLQQEGHSVGFEIGTDIDSVTLKRVCICGPYNNSCDCGGEE